MCNKLDEQIKIAARRFRALNREELFCHNINSNQWPIRLAVNLTTATFLYLSVDKGKQLIL